MNLINEFHVQWVRSYEYKFTLHTQNRAQGRMRPETSPIYYISISKSGHTENEFERRTVAVSSTAPQGKGMS